MNVITYILLISLLNPSLGDDECVIKASTEIMWEKELIKDLECRQNLFYTPKLPNSEPLSVQMKFILKYFSFSSDEEDLLVHTWVFISWVDERLKWDPDKYGGLTKLETTSFWFWTPSFRLYNSVASNDFDRFLSAECNLKNDGHVQCVPRMIHKARCSVKLTNFPYDVQECTLQFGPWDRRKENFNMNISSRAISMWGAEYGSQWFISDYRQQSQKNTERQLNMTFVLEREALSLAAVIVYPSLIISALTLACLFLDVTQNIRLGLICFSIFSHSYWLAELGYNIPKESVDTPNLLLYYRGSLIVTVFSLLTTFVLNNLSKRQTEPHNIIISINSFVYKGYIRFLMFPRWVPDCLVVTDENRHNENWTKFVYCVDTVCGVIIVVTYIGLYFTLIPQPVPINF